jgi:hypothetical protein
VNWFNRPIWYELLEHLNLIWTDRASSSDVNWSEVVWTDRTNLSNVNWSELIELVKLRPIDWASLSDVNWYPLIQSVGLRWTHAKWLAGFVRCELFWTDSIDWVDSSDGNELNWLSDFIWLELIEQIEQPALFSYSKRSSTILSHWADRLGAINNADL